MAARHRPFRDSKVEKDRREAKEREELALQKALTQQRLESSTRVWELFQKLYPDVPAGPAASITEVVLTSTTPGASGKELVSSAEKSRIALVDVATKIGPIDPPCMDLTPGSPEAALVALDDLAKKIQTDVTALCMTLKSADNPPASERQRRAYEVVAVMKQRLQHFEKSIALTVTPLDYEVSSPESGAPGLTNGKAVRPTVSSCATAVKAVQQVIGKPAGAESIKPDRSGNSGEPTLTSMDCDGIDDWSDPVNAGGSTSIFVGDIPMAATVDQLQVMIGVKAEIVRYHENRKFGHAKIVLSKLDVVRVLELQLTVSGQKLRVAEDGGVRPRLTTCRRSHMPPTVGSRKWLSIAKSGSRRL